VLPRPCCGAWLGGAGSQADDDDIAKRRFVLQRLADADMQPNDRRHSRIPVGQTIIAMNAKVLCRLCRCGWSQGGSCSFTRLIQPDSAQASNLGMQRMP